MKRTLITLGTLASIAILPASAWAEGPYYPGGGHRGGGGFGAGAILGGVIGGVIGGVLANKARSSPGLTLTQAGYGRSGQLNRRERNWCVRQPSLSLGKRRSAGRHPR